MMHTFRRRAFNVVRTAIVVPVLIALARNPSVAASVVKTEPPQPRRLDFDADVRPMLAEHCYACHGPDQSKRQAGLRFDTPDGPFKRLDSGRAAVVPRDVKTSEMIERITSVGPLQMPPASFKRPLTPKQIATLKLWIAQGGRYDPHWAFIPPKRPPLPPVKDAAWAHNPIDRFVLAHLEKEGLRPSPTADRRTLIRRVALDLTGLPPTIDEVNAFLADRAPNAYEKVVDRLLASPRYGERMALTWLDYARYADTHGFHIDSGRDMWRWRDWVIDAYNNNMPYDQFAVKQLAGDLLPNATLDDRIATGFNRNHPIDFEGGAIPEEYQVAYVVDRVDTTATTFLGLTMRCGQCHDHKYDPISQKEYYQFYAFFNHVPEQGLDGQKGNAVPFIKAPLPGQQEKLDAATAIVKTGEAALAKRVEEAAPRVAAWAKSVSAQNGATTVSTGLIAHFALDEDSGATVIDLVDRRGFPIVGKSAWRDGLIGKSLLLDGDAYVDAGAALANFDRSDKFSYGAWVMPTSDEALTVISKMDDAHEIRGWDLFISGGRVFAHLIHSWDKDAIRVNTKDTIPLNKWTHVMVTYDGSSKATGLNIYVNGKAAELDRTNDTLTGTIRNDVSVKIGRRTNSGHFKGRIDELRVYNRELSADEVKQIAEFDRLRPILAVAPENWSAGDRTRVRTFYLDNYDPTYRKLNADLADARAKQQAADDAIPTTMVMEEQAKPRPTFILARGQYDKPTVMVEPGTPSCLPPLPKGAPLNRLTFARWLVDPANPLTSRVAVNRFWQGYFGVGIVKTVEDFGTQGERPSNPQLLDWLATEFIRTGWDVKAMQRLIVTSATYRQSSSVTPAQLTRDPENRLLARGPRQRLPAEFIRDQALAVAGLLTPKIGGPSVEPYQPAGLWEELAFGGGFSRQSYVQDHGEDLYRRGMYTFWKRTCPPVSLQTFDAPEREFCVVRRSTTNTPLQALVLMNDPTYVEASRKFAERIMTQGGSTPAARIRFAYLTALARPPTARETLVLERALQGELHSFRADPVKADKLLSVGESDRNFNLDMCQLAAYTTIANVVLNLDETITKN